MLDDDEEFTISTDQGIGVKGMIYIQYANFAMDVNQGERVLVDDGKIVLEVVSTNGKNEAIVKVINGGILSSKKGVNLPNTKISLPCLTPKDIEDLDFALEHDVEWVGLSFVRNAADVIQLKELIAKKKKRTKVVAKIEKPEAIADFENILRESDIVALHVPLNEKTRHLIGREEFGLMKNSAILINTARGPVVDERALVVALEDGEITGAGLDVFEHEPEIEHALLKSGKVVLTPHTASATYETRDEMSRIAAQNIVDVLENKDPYGLVNI